MIIRVFHGYALPGRSAAFASLCEEISLPMLRREPGLLAAHAGAPTGCPDEYLVVSIWKDLDGLRSFTGPQWRDVVILPGEAMLLVRATVEHYNESYSSLIALSHVGAGTLTEREARVTRSWRLSDAQWERIRALLPPPKETGRPRADDRCTLDGILYILRTGSRWQDLPPHFGSPVTCWRRFNQWEASGAWERIWQALFASLTTREKLVWARRFLAVSPPPMPLARRRQKYPPRAQQGAKTGAIN